MTRARDIANLDGLLTTTGDIYYASAAATPARLGIGTSGQVLAVSSGIPAWTTASSGAGNMAQIATGSTTSGSSFTVSGLSSYTEILIMLYSVRISTGRTLTMRLNSNSGSNYSFTGNYINLTSPAASNFVTVGDTSWAITYTNMDTAQAQTSWAIKLTNCKNTGFTDMDLTSNLSGVIIFNGKGIYTVSEAVSSFTIAVGSPATWDNGSYVVWGA
jgi:hypothetical protein